MRYGKTLIGALVAALSFTAAAAEYPSDTVRIVVPWRAGGGTDTIARAFGAAMEELIDQAVVVENIHAGNGATGMLAVKNSAPDGHTLLLNGSSDLNSPILFTKTPYALEDYRCAGAFFQTPTWVLAHKDSGITDLAQFLEQAKAKPDELTVGVGNLASAHRVLASAVLGRNDVKARIIPFDGGGPLKKAILANQVTIGVIHSPVLLDAVKNGDVNVIATGGSLAGIVHEPVRDTKLIAEYNTPVEIGTTRGIFVAKDTPDAVLAEVEALLERTAKSESFREFGLKFGFEPIWMSGEEHCRFVADEQEAFRQVKADYIDGR